MSMRRASFRSTFWRRGAAVLLLLAGLLVFPPLAAAQGDEPLRVPPGERVVGNVATTSQSIVVDGDVTGDVTSWSGDILINGRVGGDVVSYAGRVTLGPAAHVGGSVLAAGHAVQSQPSANIVGQALSGAESGGRMLANAVSLVAPRASAPPATQVGAALFGLMVTLLLLAFPLLWAALWPHRTAAAAYTLRSLPLRAVALGLLTTLVLAALLLPLSALLLATLIGAPLLLLLLLLLHLPYLYGMTVLVHRLGGGPSLRLASTFSPTPRVILVAGLAAALIGLMAARAPLGAALLFYLLASPGLGATILSRGGTELPSDAAFFDRRFQS